MDRAKNLVKSSYSAFFCFKEHVGDFTANDILGRHWMNLSKWILYGDRDKAHTRTALEFEVQNKFCAPVKIRLEIKTFSSLDL